MTKLSVQTVIREQLSENSCPGTRLSTKQMHKELKTFSLLLPVSKPLFLLCIFIIELYKEVNYWIQNFYSLLTSQREKDSVKKTNFGTKKSIFILLLLNRWTQGWKAQGEEKLPLSINSVSYPVCLQWWRSRREQRKDQQATPGQWWAGLEWCSEENLLLNGA